MSNSILYEKMKNFNNIKNILMVYGIYQMINNENIKKNYWYRMYLRMKNILELGEKHRKI